MTKETFKIVLLWIAWFIYVLVASVLISNAAYMLLSSLLAWKNTVVENPLPISGALCFIAAVILYIVAWAAWPGRGGTKAKAKIFRDIANEKHREAKRKQAVRNMENTMAWLSSCVLSVISFINEDEFPRKQRCLAKHAKVLGLGIVSIDESVFSPFISDMLDLEERVGWEEQVERQKPAIQAVCHIWKYALGGLKIGPLYNFDDDDRKTVLSLAEKLGVPGMLEAYAAGVPVEDIIAK